MISSTTDDSIGFDLEAPIDVAAELQYNKHMDIDGNGNVVTQSATGKAFTFTKGVDIKDIQITSTADNTKWNSSYGIQTYTNESNISNVKISGFNAAILVNGGETTLSGKIDVSGNTFGGIEVSKGKSSTLTASILNIGSANIINTTEAYKKPTIWIDGTSEDIGIVNGADKFTKVEIDGQIHYYISAENAVDPAAE